MTLKKKYFALNEEDLSAALEYLYKKGTEEVIRNCDQKKLAEKSILKEDILYFKGRILDEQTLKSIGELEDIINIEGFTGYNFHVPMLYRHSPLALSIASHLHYNVLQHKGQETCYRLSMGYVHILEGRAVFRNIADDCVKCKMTRKKYLDVEMGVLHDAQIYISPVFYCTMVDLFGPLKCYCPGYERITRKGTKQYKVYMMVMVCVATGAVNVQVIEGADTDNVMSGFNRFFSETTVPKIIFPDQGSQLLKALNEMDGMVYDLKYRLAEQRGIIYKTCLPQGHSSHGKVERVIQSLQESLNIADIKAQRLTATAWQTIAKGVERSYNSLPIGCYYRRGEQNASILKILTPNLLMGKVSSRSPAGLFEVTRDAGRLMENVYKLFQAWYQLWNTIYLPQILERQKWFNSTESLQADDIVLFKLTESQLSTQWVLGKVETIKRGRDGLVRECVILYKSIGEIDAMLLVERPVREVVKLFHIDDTSLYEDIENARKISETIIKDKTEYAAQVKNMSSIFSLRPKYARSESNTEKEFLNSNADNVYHIFVTDMFHQQLEMLETATIENEAKQSDWTKMVHEYTLEFNKAMDVHQTSEEDDADWQTGFNGLSARVLNDDPTLFI